MDSLKIIYYIFWTSAFTHPEPCSFGVPESTGVYISCTAIHPMVTDTIGNETFTADTARVNQILKECISAKIDTLYLRKK